MIDLLDRAAQTIRASPLRRGSAVRLPARGRLLATGDLHDNQFHLRKIVAVARLQESIDHHLVLHELIHGENLINSMDFSYRMLLRVADLVLRYPMQVHPMLANHEIAQLIGRGISKGAGNSVLLFNDAIDFTFGDAAGEVSEAINRYIAALPLAVLSESGVCCAHSLPNEAMMERFDAGVLDRELADEDYQPKHGSAYLMTWGRGYTESQVAELAERWNVRLFCLGHEHAETGIEVRGSQVIVLNTDHDRATVVPLDLSQVPTAEEALIGAIPLAAIGE